MFNSVPNTKKIDVKKTSSSVTERKPKPQSAWSTFGRKKIDTAFGMNISDSSIELLEFRPFFTHKPSSYSRVSLEDGIIERGVIVNKAVLEDKIKTLLLAAKPGKVSTNRVALSLPEEQVFTWSIAINKAISGSELRKKIFDEARKVVPLDFRKIYWDFVVYPLKEKELQYVTFVGIHQDVLNAYVEICNRLGLEIVDFSLSCINLARVFLPYSDRDDYVLLDIGGETSTISVLGGNRLLKLSVTIPTAGDDMTKAIAAAMAITELEAEQLKIKFGVSDGPSPAYKTAVEKILGDVLQQVTGAIAYYEKNSGETVDAIYLTGGSSLLSGIDTYVSRVTGKQIMPLASLPFITKSDIFNKEINLKLYADAVGLALLGISQDYKVLSFRKQIQIQGAKLGFFQRIKTGYFSVWKMIFSPAHVTYGGLLVLIVALTTAFTLMYLSIRQGS